MSISRSQVMVEINCSWCSVWHDADVLRGWVWGNWNEHRSPSTWTLFCLLVSSIPKDFILSTSSPSDLGLKIPLSEWLKKRIDWLKFSKCSSFVIVDISCILIFCQKRLYSSVQKDSSQGYLNIFKCRDIGNSTYTIDMKRRHSRATCCLNLRWCIWQQENFGRSAANRFGN